jgi:hypothetical protein
MPGLERIRERTRHSEVYYSREFVWGHDTSAGFSFPSDARGTIEVKDAALENLFNCIMGVYDVVDEGIRSYHHSWSEPAAVRCDCGGEVELADSLYNECEACGLGINGSGQRLAPVEQWSPEDRYDVFGPRRA